MLIISLERSSGETTKLTKRVVNKLESAYLRPFFVFVLF